jgi:hypothetical protein
MPMPKNNTTGIVGVYWDKQRCKWTARIKAHKINQFLGRFDNKEEAISKRKEAEIKYGFHVNHGKQL